MAEHSLDHQSPSLNLSVRSYDLLYHSLGQAHVLAHVALLEHFASCDHSIIHYYLSLLEEVILTTRNAFESEFKSHSKAINV
jgi:hypothetical protein